jgi:hypothetical protein
MEKPVALEHLDTPDDNESQERALITNVAETLPSLERNVRQYMDLTAKSPEAASKVARTGIGGPATAATIAQRRDRG